MTDQIDLDDLERLAQAATPGPWEADCCSAANMVYGQGDSIGVDATEDDALFIAAANPETVLALIDRVKRAEVSRDNAHEGQKNLMRQHREQRARAERAEAVIAEVKRLAELDVRCPCCTGYENILDTLTIYQNGADQS